MKYILIPLLAFLLMGSSTEDARKANEAYDNGDYEEAIALFKKAIDAEPDNAKLLYNLASAQAKAGESEEAIRTFEQFKDRTDDAERRAMADYDIGNILAESEEWDQALDYYKKSLRYMDNDEDAKHNYELAQRKKGEKENEEENQQDQDQDQDQNQDQQEQQDQQDEQDQQQQNQDENQQQDQQNQDQDQNQDQQNQEQQDQNQDQQNQQDQQQQQQQSQQSKMSQAEADKILKALEQKEKDLLQEFKKQNMKSSKNTNEKDW